MIRILHVVSVMDIGGMESYIMNIYRRVDRDRMQFDFLVHHGRRGAFEDEIEALGGRVFHTTLLDDFNLPKYLRDLKRLYAGGDYRIVHGHLGSTALLYLGEAERQHVPWRILHAHCSNHTQSLKGYAKHLLFQLAPRHANVRLACSDKAGQYLFKRQPFEITPNGIETGRFAFSAGERQAVRTRLHLEGRFVVGHVGRFTAEKNHAFILDLFAELKRRCPEAALMLIGGGKLKEAMQEKAERLGVADSVMFMGVLKDCAPYYQAMDAFVMPSEYEGLPLAGIEAQCAALPCLFSDTISAQVQLSAGARFLPVGKHDVDAWADALMEARGRNTDRAAVTVDSGRFDVDMAAKRMEERYAALWERKP